MRPMAIIWPLRMAFSTPKTGQGYCYCSIGMGGCESGSGVERAPRPAHQPFAFCLRDLRRNSVCPRDKALDLALIRGVISIGCCQPRVFFACFEIVKDAPRKRHPDSEP